MDCIICNKKSCIVIKHDPDTYRILCDPTKLELIPEIFIAFYQPGDKYIITCNEVFYIFCSEECLNSDRSKIIIKEQINFMGRYADIFTKDQLTESIDTDNITDDLANIDYYRDPAKLNDLLELFQIEIVTNVEIDIDEIIRVAEIIRLFSKQSTLSSIMIQTAVKIVLKNNAPDIVSKCCKCAMECLVHEKLPDNYKKSYDILKKHFDKVAKNAAIYFSCLIDN
jgi:hypothetical protein